MSNTEEEGKQKKLIILEENLNNQISKIKSNSLRLKILKLNSIAVRILKLNIEKKRKNTSRF